MSGYSPLVSVIVPTYNCDRYIGEAVESVLAQTTSPYEIIVVDDGSTDNTAQALAPYRDSVHVVRQDNQGVAAARNAGIALAKGDLIAFLDADDTFFPEKLAKQADCFVRSPTLGMVISGWQIVTKAGELLSIATPWKDNPVLDLKAAVLCKPARPSATMIRRDWCRRTGGFDTALSSAEDLDFLLRLMLEGCEAMWLPEVQVSYRQHAGSLMTQGQHLLHNTDQVMARLFSHPDLSAEIRKLKQQERYQSLVWLAARMYYDGYVPECEACLKQSLSYVTERSSHIIFDWFQAFKGYATDYGFQFDSYALTSSKEWKRATECVLFPWQAQSKSQPKSLKKSLEKSLEESQAEEKPAPPAGLSDKQILLYSDDPGAGGILQCNHAIVCHLTKAGYSVSHMHCNHETPLTQKEALLGVQPIDLGYHADSDMSRSFKDVEGIKHSFQAHSVDLIIFSDGWPFSNLAAKQAAFDLGIPYIIVLGFVEPSCVDYSCQDGVSYRDLAALQYARSQSVVAVSEENLSLLRRLFDLPDAIGQVIYNGRPAEYFVASGEPHRQRLRQAFDIPADGVMCFTSGRLEPVKGYQHQIEAMKHLKKNLVWEKLYFVWAGPGLAQMSRSNELSLRAAADAAGVTDRVRFLGQRWDVAAWLEASDIFVLTSEAEGMPLSVMEAMAKGLPVVATAVSGIPEELGDTGQLLTSPNEDAVATVNELVNVIERWASSAALRQDVGARCQQRARKLFQQAEMVRQYEAVVRDVLTGDRDTQKYPGRTRPWVTQKVWDVERQFRYASWVWQAWARYEANDFEGMDAALTQALTLRPAAAGWPIFEWGEQFMRLCREQGRSLNGDGLTGSQVWRRFTLEHKHSSVG